MISTSKIIFSKQEEKAVLQVMRSGRLTQGPQIKEFERNFARYIGQKYAIAVGNGTQALHLAILSLGIGKGDEVITTPFSFIGSANAVIYTGAKPVFVDIGTDYNMDISKIEAKITSKTRAIMPVHLFGNSCDMDELTKLASKHGLHIIEDACQAHGALYKGKKAGSFGILSCFSFYATKNMTTGEGGMILTSDAKLYDYLIKARSHGSLKKYFHEFLGFNDRMTEIQAAIGIVQLKKLNKFNQKRIKNATYLNKHLFDVKGIILPKVEADKRHIFHQYVITVTKSFAKTRDQLLKILERHGIESIVHYPMSINLQRSMVDLGYRESLPKSEEASKRVLSLPVHPDLTKKDLDLIIKTIKDIAK